MVTSRAIDCIKISFLDICYIGVKIIKTGIKKMFFNRNWLTVCGAYTLITLMVKFSCLISAATTHALLSLEMAPKNQLG